MWVCESLWPDNVEQLLEYVRALEESEGLPNQYQEFLGALSFMEKAGWVAVSEALHQNQGLGALIRELRVDTKGRPTRPRRQAPRLPLSAVLALEQLVIDEEAKVYIRMYAWFKLLKIWGALRFDDHRGLDPSRLVLTGVVPRES